MYGVVAITGGDSTTRISFRGAAHTNLTITSNMVASSNGAGKVSAIYWILAQEDGTIEMYQQYGVPNIYEYVYQIEFV